MSKVIALAIGMTGTFFATATGGAGQRAEITRIWSETCVNIKITSGAGFGFPDPTSVFVPPLDTPAERHPAGYYFLPDAFVAVALAEPTIEQSIVQAGANVAPRVTPDDIKANIVSEHYFTGEDGVFGALHSTKSDITGRPAVLAQLTFCVLVLRNGFLVTGESACASPENFKPEIGRRIARENAVDKIWPLMGYALKEQLAHGTWIRGTADHTD